MIKSAIFILIAATVWGFMGCAAIDRQLGCPTYQNVYCSARWVCDKDNYDGCEICECMPFYGPDGQPPWEMPGY